MNEQPLFRLIKNCDIYFEDSLISKEFVIKNYANFLAASFSGESHSVSVALHTGSVCFDVVSFVIAAVRCLLMGGAHSDEIIESIEIGNIVLYGEHKQERYIWGGFVDIDYNPILTYSETSDNRFFAVLEQPTKATRTYAPRPKWHLITPYYGNSQTTDGRGLRKRDSSRNDFVSYLFGVSPEDVPSVTEFSVVLVAERSMFERISKGVRIVYNGDKSIGLLDIVTASYYTSSGEEYQFGTNPAKSDPVLKVTGKVATARDLVLDKSGNKTVGFMIVGSEHISNAGTELIDLLGRKSLGFAHLVANIDSDSVENIIESNEDMAVFACTKEFLLQNSLPPQTKNVLTAELDRQIEHIINNTVSTVTIDGGFARDDHLIVKAALDVIRKSDWNVESKNTFLITAYSLLNLFATAIFPIEALERAIENSKLAAGISSPHSKVLKLWELANNAGVVTEQCVNVINILEQLYKEGLSKCRKYDVLKQQIIASAGRKIVVVVPKSYYIDIVLDDESLNLKNATFVTVNRFDNSEQYDEVLVSGHYNSKKFNPLKCRVAPDITVLLYECEIPEFQREKHRTENYEHKLNARLGIVEDAPLNYGENSVVAIIDSKDMDASYEEMNDLDQYINSISIFDIRMLAEKASGMVGSTPTSEVCAAGRFVSGEQILFSKYYKAVVFDSGKGTVTEIDVEDLAAGDMLVFVKRDDYTRNMVDYLYESLVSSGGFSKEVSAASEKAWYWKEALREYRNSLDLSYRDVALKLQKLGSSLREATIRQWLTEESHVVGPRERKTLVQIADLTQDEYLLNDPDSFFESIRVVRHKRREVLDLIGRSITDNLNGRKPPKGSVLEVVYSNVENLSETLELESIFVLENPVIVPINTINKPIVEWEVIM